MINTVLYKYCGRRYSRLRGGLTRYFIVYEIAEKIEGIVERRTNVLATRRLEANRGVKTACLAIDVRRHKVICTVLGLVISNQAHNQNKQPYRIVLFRAIITA